MLLSWKNEKKQLESTSESRVLASRLDPGRFCWAKAFSFFFLLLPFLKMKLSKLPVMSVSMEKEKNTAPARLGRIEGKNLKQKRVMRLGKGGGEKLCSSTLPCLGLQPDMPFISALQNP